MRVKICGITTLEDALAACDAGADALGFNFSDEAKRKGRYISPTAASEITEALPPFITTVAVCVNAPVHQLFEYLDIVDRVQLHGDEPASVGEEVAPRSIKAFRLRPAFDIEAMRGYPALAYLVDAFVPGQQGGTGTTCDWELARKTTMLGKPVILAGGLTPENVAEAIRTVRPYGVDVAGGVESAPGKKDHERIRRFIENARASLS